MHKRAKRSKKIKEERDEDDSSQDSTTCFIDFNKEAIRLQSQELKRLNEEANPSQSDDKTAAAAKEGGLAKTPKRNNINRKFNDGTINADQLANIKTQNQRRNNAQTAAVTLNDNNQKLTSGNPRNSKNNNKGGGTTQQQQSMAQMHANFRQILKQTAKEAHDKRKNELQERQKTDSAVRHLHQVTRKIPPRVDSVPQKTHKERNYLNFRRPQGTSDNALLKRMVNQELDYESKELLDLAERVGYLDPLRRVSSAQGFNNFTDSVSVSLVDQPATTQGANTTNHMMIKRRKTSQPDFSSTLNRKSRLMIPQIKQKNPGRNSDFLQVVQQQSNEQFSQTTKNDRSSPFKKLKIKGNLRQQHTKSLIEQQEQQTSFKDQNHMPSAPNLKDVFRKPRDSVLSNSTSVNVFSGLRSTQSRLSQAEFTSSIRHTKHQIHSYFHQGKPPIPNYEKNLNRRTQVKFHENLQEYDHKSLTSTPKIRIGGESSDRFSSSKKKSSGSKHQAKTLLSSPGRTEPSTFLKMQRSSIKPKEQYKRKVVTLSGAKEDSAMVGSSTTRNVTKNSSGLAAPIDALTTQHKSAKKQQQQLMLSSQTDGMHKESFLSREQLSSRQGGRTSQATTAITRGDICTTNVNSRPSLGASSLFTDNKSQSAFRAIEQQQMTPRSRNFMGNAVSNTESLINTQTGKPRTVQPSFQGALLPGEHQNITEGNLNLNFKQNRFQQQTKNQSKFLLKVQEQETGQSVGDSKGKLSAQTTIKRSSEKQKISARQDSVRSKQNSARGSKQSRGSQERLQELKQLKPKPSLREILKVVDKGVMARQRELEIQRSEHFHDFMHRLAMAFSKWIQIKLNEESYLHKDIEMHIKHAIHKKQLKDQLHQLQESSNVTSQQDTTSISSNANEMKKEMHHFLKHKQIKYSSSLHPAEMTELAFQIEGQDNDFDEEKKDDKPSLTQRNGSITNKHRKTMNVQFDEQPDKQASSKESLFNKRGNSEQNLLQKGRLSMTKSKSGAAALKQKFKSFKKKDSIDLAPSEELLTKMHREEESVKLIGQLKSNMKFKDRIYSLREQVLTWVTEMCKEEGKRDYDKMAELISEFEQLGDKGVISWAMGRISTISPSGTIGQAEKKLNGVIEAIQYKYKRMMNFVLEKHDFRQNDFFEAKDDALYDFDEEAQCMGAAQNINYVHQKLEGVKELINDKMLELVQKMFEDFVREFTHDRNPLFENKMIFYCLLKTEGDIMIELNDYDKAIKAYKALRNYCRAWGLMEQEMWMAEQIGMCYRTLRYHELATDYFKYQLSLAWEMNDQKQEMKSYDNLAIEYYYIGNITKAKLYHDRVFKGRGMQTNSISMKASLALNKYNRNYKEKKYNFDQLGLKGIHAEDKGKRANFGEYESKYIPKEESDKAVDYSQQQQEHIKRLEFEKELRIDAEQAGTKLDQNLMAFSDMHNMSKHEKVLEHHKRAARRNFLLASQYEQEQIRERYKPSNVKKVVRLQGGLPDKIKPFSEEEFRMKVRESANRLFMKEKGHAENIFYTHLSKNRRCEKPSSKPVTMLRNCRQYLEYMESYIINVVKQKNLENQKLAELEVPAEKNDLEN